MRVYVGEVDDGGRARVWVTHRVERIDMVEVVDVLGQLRALADPLAGAGLDRAEVLARKEALVAAMAAAEAIPAPVELVHRGGHSPDGFAWGYAGAGPADLARSILYVETGMDTRPELYLAFRDQVVAAIRDRWHFELSAEQVGEWLEANRHLVERGLVDEAPPAAVVTDDGEGPDADEAAVREATASAVVAACEAAWADIRTHHPALPEAVVVLGSGVERGRLVKLGHWWGGRWLADGQVRGEVLLAGEALHLPADKVFEVLLHEAAHGLNAAAGVKDTSRGGRYHNQRFADSAKAVLLEVTATPPYGLAGTDLTDEGRQRYGDTIERLGEQIRIARRLERETAAGVEGGTGGGAGADGGNGGGKSRGSVVAVCGCERKLRMAPTVLAKGPVTCGVCGDEFRSGVEPPEPGRPGTERQAEADHTGADADDSVVDHSFVGRRRAMLEQQRRSDDVRSTVGRQVAVVDAAHEEADGPALVPLRERRARLAVLLVRAAGAVPARPVADPSEAEAVRSLCADGLAPTRLLRWYEELGAPHSAPMAAADHAEAAALTRMARILLTVDRTLSGPVVEVDGRPFQAGDHVVAVAEVPGGPPAGTPGSILEADDDRGALRIDFPIWGRVQASAGSALARTLDHDYTEVVAPEAAPDSADIGRELERPGLELEP